MEQYLIVKKYIDEMDYLDLLASHAPDNEFDEESKEITAGITNSSTIQEIAQIITKVYNKRFCDKSRPNMFIDCAEKIYCDIHKH